MSREIYNHFWVLRPEVLTELADDVSGRLNAHEVIAARTAMAAAEDTGAEVTGDLAVIPLRGLLTPRGSFLSFLFGGGSGGVQGFRETFRAAVADDSIASILIDIDSPGGRASLIPEAAADIRAARASKPIVAIANTMAGSGAYWIGSQADEFVISPSGMAGSIGAYYLHEDVSEAAKEAGIKFTFISAGKYKIEGNPYEPLDREAKAAWQRDCDDFYEMFVADVAAGRGVSADTVKSGYGEGRTLPAERAVAAGLADRIETFEQTCARLGVAPVDEPDSDDVDDFDDGESATTSPPGGSGEAQHHGPDPLEALLP